MESQGQSPVLLHERLCALDHLLSFLLRCFLGPVCFSLCFFPHVCSAAEVKQRETLRPSPLPSSTVDCLDAADVAFASSVTELCVCSASSPATAVLTSSAHVSTASFPLDDLHDQQRVVPPVITAVLVRNNWWAFHEVLSLVPDL